MFFKEYWPSAEKKEKLRLLGKFCYSKGFLFFAQVTVIVSVFPSIFKKLNKIYELSQKTQLEILFKTTEQRLSQQELQVVKTLNSEIQSLLFYLGLIILISITLILIQSRGYFKISFKKIFTFKGVAFYKLLIPNFFKFLILAAISTLSCYWIFTYAVREINNLKSYSQAKALSEIIKLLSSNYASLIVIFIVLSLLSYIFSFLVYQIKHRMNADEI
jgi:flagellar biosynthesis protein FlhB